MEHIKLTSNYSLALKTAIDEIRNVNPEVSDAFIFQNDGEIIAHDDNTNVQTIQQAIDFFNEITSRSDAVGGFENLTIRGSKGHINFAVCTEDFYLATVSSKMFDEKTLFTLNHLLVPVVIKIVKQLSQNNQAKAVQTGIEEPKQKQTMETVKPEAITVLPKKFEPLLPKAPVHQFMVEKIGGLLIAADTVRIDNEIITNWNQLYDGKIIEKVEIESLRLKTITCKFKAIKESKNTAKGIVQLPEKIMQSLEVSKGELVMIKPVI
jgi:hypothetical protein